MHWFTCNDTRRWPDGQQGSLARAGRLYVYGGLSRVLLRAFWSFWHPLRWIELEVRVDEEDALASISVILPWLAHLGIGVPLPRRLVGATVMGDRTFGVKFGYVGSIVEVDVAYAQWGHDTGMLDYYRRKPGGTYSGAQLWPGWRLVVKRPPLRWLLGRASYCQEVVNKKPVAVSLDGKVFEAHWRLERHWRERPRWPWRYGVRYASWLEVKDPPRFAGKGENSWDCDDDAIYGMGSSELTAAGAIGEYVKAVLKNRERYGMPSGR